MSFWNRYLFLDSAILELCCKIHIGFSNSTQIKSKIETMNVTQEIVSWNKKIFLTRNLKQSETAGSKIYINNIM